MEIKQTSNQIICLNQYTAKVEKNCWQQLLQLICAIFNAIFCCRRRREIQVSARAAQSEACAAVFNTTHLLNQIAQHLEGRDLAHFMQSCRAAAAASRYPYNPRGDNLIKKAHLFALCEGEIPIDPTRSLDEHIKIAKEIKFNCPLFIKTFGGLFKLHTLPKIEWEEIKGDGSSIKYNIARGVNSHGIPFLFIKYLEKRPSPFLSEHHAVSIHVTKFRRDKHSPYDKVASWYMCHHNYYAVPISTELYNTTPLEKTSCADVFTRLLKGEPVGENIYINGKWMENPVRTFPDGRSKITLAPPFEQG